MKTVKINNLSIGDGRPLVLVAGPCVIEDRETCLALARRLKGIAQSLDIPFVFKASYDKANRSSLHSYRGPGLKKGLEILKEVKEAVGVPVLSDVHSPEEAEEASKVLDVLQIPAFLCRQTDLLIAAAQTGRPVNIKKGQFLAPWDMKYVAEKVSSTGNDQIILTERGTAFGYNNLVSDMRSVVIMKGLGYPVLYDATHSVQIPGGLGHASGGQREMVFPLARAAVAAGADGLFIEVHESPEKALSDSATMVPVDQLLPLLEQAKKIRTLLLPGQG
ncbi:MAG TPA: 3-deoxy-8-phosphooctulonate synthase [Candidatus Brocadiales bacterium]|nr:3-deoxy-8-phosphooctulonate synthase [Candidatus Brocadiales bacterium]